MVDVSRAEDLAFDAINLDAKQLAFYSSIKLSVYESFKFRNESLKFQRLNFSSARYALADSGADL